MVNSKLEMEFVLIMILKVVVIVKDFMMLFVELMESLMITHVIYNVQKHNYFQKVLVLQEIFVLVIKDMFQFVESIINLI